MQTLLTISHSASTITCNIVGRTLLKAIKPAEIQKTLIPQLHLNTLQCWFLLVENRFLKEFLDSQLSPLIMIMKLFSRLMLNHLVLISRTIALHHISTWQRLEAQWLCLSLWCYPMPPFKVNLNVDTVTMDARDEGRQWHDRAILLPLAHVNPTNENLFPDNRTCSLWQGQKTDGIIQ